MSPQLGSIKRQSPGYRATLLALRDFSGGLNLRDTATELGPTESPDLWNVVLDERGGIVKRLGYTRWNASAVANPITFGYESKVAGANLWYSRADGKLYREPGSGVLTLVKTFTANGRLGLVDFAGKVYAVHPVDGLFSSSDGTTWAAVTASSGTLPTNSYVLANWQNKLWVAGNGNRLYFSAAGDTSKWAAADGAGSNDVREKDDAAIVALRGASGFDQQARPSLVVGKQESIYRVYDSTTGAYVTIDASVGPLNQKCLVQCLGNVFILSRKGLFRTTGFAAASLLSDRVKPLFTPDALNYAQSDNFCAVAEHDRLRFSLVRVGSNVPDLCLRLHPLEGWITAGSDAANCYIDYTANTEIVLGAAPAAAGQIYRFDASGTDDGAPIKSWWLSRVFEPSDGFMARLQQVRVLARGQFTLSLLPDFAVGGKQRLITVVGIGAHWDADHWDVGVWGDPRPEAYQPWFARQLCRALQFRIDETSSLSSTSPPLLEVGSGAPVGGWAMYSLLCDFTPLGLS